MTGWGQTGPWATMAGHDINYISLTGALAAIGLPDHPVPPLNLVGDYGGGSMVLVTSVLAALWERTRSGLGQVVDAAMVNGVSVLVQPVLEMRTFDGWNDRRADNVLDGAAPYYRTYACADGRHLAVGCIEPQFYQAMITILGLQPDELPDRDDRREWPRLTERVRGDLRTPYSRPVGRVVRRNRRLRDPGPHVRGSSDASSHGRSCGPVLRC
jgi:alpha-methylacyl-CoA racemase